MGDWLYLFAGRGAPNSSSVRHTHTHTHTQRRVRDIRREGGHQTAVSLFCVHVLVAEERNNREKTEGERERSVFRLPAPAGFTSPEYYNYQPSSLQMSCQWESEKERRKKKRKRRKRTSSREEQFYNFLITFLATFACAVVNATNWMFLWFLSK